MKFNEKLNTLNQKELERLDSRITKRIYECIKKMENIKIYNYPIMNSPIALKEFENTKQQIDNLKCWKQKEIGKFVETILKTRTYKKPYS